MHLCASPATAQTQTAYSGQVGGPGGGAFDDPCRPGDVLVGVNVTTGKAINTVGPVCQSTSFGAVYGLRTWGVDSGPGSGGAFGSEAALRCPSNTAVAKIHAYVDKYGILSSIALYCRAVSGGPTVEGGWFAASGKSATSGDAECPADFVAIGMTGGYGALVDRIGLKCGLFKQVTAPPPAKPIKHTGKGNACVAYGDHMSAIAGEARSLGCKFVQIAPWNNPRNYWVERCVAHAGDGVADSEEAKLKQRLNDCKTASTGSSSPARGEGGGGETPQTPADMGGMPPMLQTDGTCGRGNAMATVVINQPGLDKLNVRTGPGGQVIGTVPEGGTVSVIGPCGATGGAAGFAKPKTQQGGRSGKAGGWCQISAPVHGCVSSQFLAFHGGDVGMSPGGAAGFAKSKSKPQASTSAADFSGQWAANADNVAYTVSLKQKGTSVSGSYQGADGSAGTISGKMNGNVLRFGWVQKDGTRGSGKFVLADDGQSFDGTYNFSNTPDAVEGNWNGSRQ